MNQKSSALNTVRYLALVVWVLVLGCEFGYGQSTSQDYPSPVVSNELSGLIKPRDIGDPRLTTYYYTFNGNQGDVFINVVTKNLNGNIDVFSVDGLRLLTRILVFADVSDNETGRVVYLRKPERLILRVEGRTPNDDPASFQIKFAGSFEAVAADSVPAEPKLPELRAENDTGIRVNSAGAIVEVRPKPTPVTVARAETEEKPPIADEKRTDDTETKSGRRTTEETPEKPKRATVVVEETTKPSAEPKTKRSNPKAASRPTAERTSTPKMARETAAKATTEPKVTREKAAKPSEPEKPADPLANVSLIVEFKDGRRLERPMSDVFRFTVDHGSLTVIRKDGKIDKFPIIEVAKVSVQ